MERVELCLHTKMSELQGMYDAREYIEEATKRGYKTFAITDTNSTQAFFEVEDYNLLYANDENKFKVIYGAEMYFKEDEDDELSYSIFVYVKEQKGLKNLYKLISLSYEHMDNNKPIIYKIELEKYREGLLYASVGSKGEIYRKIKNNKIKELMSFYDFLGIEPYNECKEKNIKIAQICKKENKILVGVSNCNFINKEDSKYNEVLNFYKKKEDVKDGNERYFYTTEELINKFNYLENAEEIVVKNTNEIAEKIEDIVLILKKSDSVIIKKSDKIITDKCYAKVYKIYGKKLPRDVEKRLKLELDSIIKNNYQSIYLISSEVVEYSNKLGYEVGARGSVGCSFVAFLLGITKYNPITYKLPYEFFAGKNYDKEPDIDLNFSGEIQSKIFECLQNKYGKERIIWGGTIGTLADRTVENWYEEFKSTMDVDLEKENQDVIDRLCGVKKGTGIHPGGVLIIPEGMDILDFCPTEIDKEVELLKTHPDYHSIWKSGLYKFDILGHNDETMLHDLEKETGVNSNDIKLNDRKVLNLFLHANDPSYKISTKGIPEFSTKFVKEMIEVVKPKNFNDLVCISALSHGTGTWIWNAEGLIKNEGKKVDEVISNREDVFNYFVKKGINKELAYDITEFIRKGRAEIGRNLWKNIRNRYKEWNDKWDMYKEILKEHDVPDWYIKNAENIKYMFPKAHAIGYTINAFKLAWYKINYPKEFYEDYFKIWSDLNISEYYCKKQIQRELNRLYDKKERHETNTEYEYDYTNEDKIDDLEMLLEMYNRGVVEEKEEIKDDYNLINSRAICDYCRSIKHKFNTEELAVLVHRNKRMSIDEKIDKYNDLIDNYPDMKVIERINCNHYDSVKTMIKKEIERLKKTRKKFAEENEDCIYVWTEYNKSTLRYDDINDLDNVFKTYEEVYKDIEKYIKEFDDTISFRIIKKYFNKRKKEIYADYIVENKEIKLVKIIEIDNDYLDIDQIFLNIPTPFEKGDILVQTDKLWRNYGDNGSVFVLEWLCTWRKGLEELLRKGNYDSSDMIGYGYYLYEDSLAFVRDDKWDYDSFEYYDGELKGNERLLKNISSLVKEKIDVELYTHIYDYLKNGEKSWMVGYYSEKGLELAGLNKEDIKSLKNK